MFNMRVIDVTYLFILLMGIQDIYSDDPTRLFQNKLLIIAIEL